MCKIENKQKVLVAIESLKDTIFGLDSSYSSFCFLTDENQKHALDLDKLNLFIDELVNHATQCPEYQPEFEPLMRDGLYMVIVLLSREFSAREYRFDNLLKFTRAFQPNSKTNISPFDIIIGDRKENLEPAYIERYTRFSSNIDQIKLQFHDFYGSVHFAMQAYVDAHNLNPLNDDDDCSFMLSTIYQATNNILIQKMRR